MTQVVTGVRKTEVWGRNSTYEPEHLAGRGQSDPVALDCLVAGGTRPESSPEGAGRPVQWRFRNVEPRQNQAEGRQSPVRVEEQTDPDESAGLASLGTQRRVEG